MLTEVGDVDVDAYMKLGGQAPFLSIGRYELERSLEKSCHHVIEPVVALVYIA